MQFDNTEQAMRFIEQTCTSALSSADEIYKMDEKHLVAQERLIEATRDRFSEIVMRIHDIKRLRRAQKAMEEGNV